MLLAIDVEIRDSVFSVSKIEKYLNGGAPLMVT